LTSRRQIKPQLGKAPNKLARSVDASPTQEKAEQAAWKRVLHEPTVTPATKRTQRLRGVCD